jgi:hypothetical protein
MEVVAKDGTVLILTESSGEDGYKLTVRARLATEDDAQLTIVFIASGQPRVAILRIYETWLAGNTEKMAWKLRLIRKTGENFLRKPGGSLRPKKTS